MSEPTNRITGAGNPPADSQVADWVGKDGYKYCGIITQLIEQNYPNVFTPEWLYGGKKYGRALRYKKSKSFCTLIPEKNRFSLLIVFGAKEREKVEVIRIDHKPNAPSITTTRGFLFSGSRFRL